MFISRAFDRVKPSHCSALMAFPKEPEALRQALHLPESQNPVPQEGARDPSYKVVKQPQQTL